MSSRVAEGRLPVLQICRLLQCVYEGNTVHIEKMVKLGVANLINLTEPQDGTGALHVAVSANSQDLISFLLSQGADPNIQDKKGRTPGMLAAELGNHAIVELLTQSNADLKLQDAEGRGVLFYCMYPTNRHTRCLQLALKCQADANNVSKQGLHVFQLMCEKAQESTPMCLAMLDGGADPNASNQKTGVTALMGAAKAGSLPLVRDILRKGGLPDTLDRTRLSAVHYAAMGGFFEVIQVLSAFSANMCMIDLEDCTPLHYAAATGSDICCKFLAQRGCNPKLKNYDGLLPRQIAKDSGHKAAAKELRKAEKLQGTAKPSTGISPMTDLWALTLHDWSHEMETELREAFGSDLDTVPTDMFFSVLEELKAPAELDHLQTVISAHDKEKAGCININDFFKGVRYIKKTFLLSAFLPKKKKEKKAKGGKKKKGKFVLTMPICTLTPEFMPRRKDGGPPHLMIETYTNSSDIRRFDRDHPPEHPIVNDSGWYIEKPEKVFVNVNDSVKSGDLESLDLAFSKGVSVDVRDQFYKTPLMVACSTGNFEMAQYLLNHGANVNMCDQFFWTPLHHAAQAGQVELVELLVKAGAAIESKALSGGTPLMRAIQSSRPSCVDFLIKAGASVIAENKKEQNCLDIAVAFGDPTIIELVKEKMESMPKLKEGAKGKGKPAKKKVFAAVGAVHPEFLTAAAGKTSHKDSNSIILQNARITAGKTNVDMPFVPKTVWGKPPTTSQLMSKIERRKNLLSLDLDFEDLMMPFSNNIHRPMLERVKTTD
ncbi:ankyrin repeat and EF-hand domain-containing protein 1a [Limanda limanda]|uniref:ankyrin repeat and EF-hand domain-containing protein 1a n=1 Tax=Limanda limanda TaxID=27771 RepID=UPI0029C843F5|nr:ankyrin repeat and EF-hand domain-containing protein 1a [Limanda limanda]